jgi:hypothetical protein
MKSRQKRKSRQMRVMILQNEKSMNRPIATPRKPLNGKAGATAIPHNSISETS